MPETINRKPWRMAMWGAAAALLIAPAVAMQVTPEVNWGPGDFAIFAAMLTGLCLAIEATMRFVRHPLRRAVFALAAVGVFLLVWAHLAVGIW